MMPALPPHPLTTSPIRLHWPGGPLRGTMHLPASKSESNRALILQALAGGGQLANLSDANDTVLMQRLLSLPDAAELDAEDAGTVMRFLTAYLAMSGRHVTLTGTARMQQRPIGVLVDALRQLGARIEYAGQEGFPPLLLHGQTPLPATDDEPIELTVRGDISSQYISALLMIGPTLPGGLRIRLSGKVGSRPYIRLTLALMHHFGAACRDLGAVLDVRPQTYHPADYRVEADWSAASYAYALVALAPPWLVVVIARPTPPLLARRPGHCWHHGTVGGSHRIFGRRNGTSQPNCSGYRHQLQFYGLPRPCANRGRGG